MKPSVQPYFSEQILAGEGLLKDHKDAWAVWTPDLQYYTSYRIDELCPILKRFAKLLSKAKVSKYQVISQFPTFLQTASQIGSWLLDADHNII